jgi:hypothetical protein
MIFYVDGCSHSFGEEEKGIIPYSNYFKPYAKVINNSQQGKANDSIFSDTIFNISSYKDKKNIYCVIQFSSANRRTHMLPNGEKIWVNPYDNIKYHLKLEPMASMDTLCYIFALQKIFDNLNINYCMLSYFPIENTQENKIFVKNNIDLTKFITYDDSNHPLFDGFIDLMKNNNLTKDEEGHPSQKGHMFLYEKIKYYFGLGKLI